METQEKIKAIETEIAGLNKRLDEVKKELVKPIYNSYKAEDWIKLDFDCTPNNPSIRKIQRCRVVGGNLNWDQYFDYPNSNWGHDFELHKIRLATEQEIKTHLEAEAKRRGFKGDFVRFKFGEIPTTDNTNNGNYRGDITRYDYVSNSDVLGYGYGIIYKQGKWATILPNEEVIEIGGYKVMLAANGIDTTIDGNKFTWEFWKAAKLISEHSKAKIMVGCSRQYDVSLETINAILDRLK